MAELDQTTAEPISPFWARVKIIMGFAPAIVALGTAITAVVKAYDQSSQKAIYEVLSKKVEENAAAVQDTHSDVKAVWSYLNGVAVGKASAVESSYTPPVTAPTSPPPVTTPIRPKVTSSMDRVPATAPSSRADQVRSVGAVSPRVRFNVVKEAQHMVIPEVFSPKRERLPSFEDVIERPKN